MTAEVYKAWGGEWRWRLKAANGLVVARSGRAGYTRRRDAMRGLRCTLGGLGGLWSGPLRNCSIKGK